MTYRIATNAYAELPTSLGPPAIVTANGWILGTALGRPTVIAGSKVVKLPTYGKSRAYVVSSFSDDGRTAAGCTTDDGNGSLPIIWTCR